MRTWRELQAAFRELQPALQFARLDYQGGAAGEYWRLAGGIDPLVRQQFEVLSKSAGRLLAAYPHTWLHEDVIRQTDDERRWYEALKAHTGIYRSDEIAYQLDVNGNRDGILFGGSLDRPAAASATLCLRLLMEEPPNSSVHALRPADPSKNETAQMTWYARLMEWLHREKEVRGLLWKVVGSIVMLTVALLKLFR